MKVDLENVKCITETALTIRGSRRRVTVPSEVIDILSEYRVFVNNAKIIHSSNYLGDFTKNIDYTYVENLISKIKYKPISFTLDVALLKDGTSELIEMNDFWSIGSYGLYCEDYFKMLNDRYFEILSNI